MTNIIFKFNKLINQKISYIFRKIVFMKFLKYDNLIKFNGRIDEKSNIMMSKSIRKNNFFPAGKRIILQTKAVTLKLYALYSKIEVLNNMSINATSGIDIYIEKEDEFKWLKTISPSNYFSMSSYGELKFDTNDEKRIIIYLPSYSSLEKLYCVSEKDNDIKVVDNSKNEIVLYGSSISQGCSASRAALSFCNLLSRFSKRNVLNFGFSESARGEKEIIEYISKLNSEIYIIEYDHNSSVEELNSNHANLYKTIRKYNPNSLIIFMSRLSGGISISEDEEIKRNNIINETYQYALNNGDTKVRFINGSNVITQNKDMFFADDRHPNDAGMKVICEALMKIINGED